MRKLLFLAMVLILSGCLSSVQEQPKLTSYEAELNDREIQIYELKIKAAELETNVSNKAIQIAQKESEILVLRNQSASKDVEITNLREAKNFYDSSLKDLQARINQLETTLVDIPEPPIKNGDFFNELNHWEIIHYSTVEDSWGALILSEDGPFSNVLDLSRANSKRVRGGVSISQQINMDVTNYSIVRVRADLKLVSYSPSGNDLLSEDYVEDDVYPLQIYVYYVDENAEPDLWTWGFLTEQYPQDKTNYYIIPEGEWYSYTSQNLVDLNPKPAMITDIFIGGNGWDFHGRADNLQIEIK